jgi:hypothetical protein
MIDMGKLREISKASPNLQNILFEEPITMSEQEFLNKFSLLWNLSAKHKETGSK